MKTDEIIELARNKVYEAARGCGAELGFTGSEILENNEDICSMLISFQFAPIMTDEGAIELEPVSVQIDYSHSDQHFYLIIGESSEFSITYGNIMAVCYFQSAATKNISDTEKSEQLFYDASKEMGW